MAALVGLDAGQITEYEKIMEAKVYLLRTPLTEPALSIMFGYQAKFYDLDAYRRINPTFPERLLNLYLLELNRCLRRTG